MTGIPYIPMGAFSQSWVRRRLLGDSARLFAVRQDEPEKIQQKLEDFLKENGVSFTYSGRTKFGNFRHRTLL